MRFVDESVDLATENKCNSLLNCQIDWMKLGSFNLKKKKRIIE